MLKRIINKIRREWNFFLDYQEIKRKLNQQNKIVYIGSPLHGNIGDHAISIATMKMFKEVSLPVVEIPGLIYMRNKKSIFKKVTLEDIIIITGGGLIGNLWMQEEEMVKSVIETFYQNKLVIFPETFYFEENVSGKMELKKLKKCINSHLNIYIMTREKNSYLFCKKHFKNTKGIYLLPDMVLTLNEQRNQKRTNLLFVLRKDKEKAFSLEKIEEYFPRSKSLDTVMPYSIKLKERENEFQKVLHEFSCSKLVVTDRLHAMIFSAITGTPCIAIDNKNKKISGVYEWIKDLEYISFCDDETKLIEQINLKLQNKFEQNYMLDQKFKKEILDLLNHILEK